MSLISIDLGYAVWAGGSGNLGLNTWIIGYAENVSAAGVASFVNWIYGVPSPSAVSPATAYFEPSLSVLGTTNSAVGVGGTLFGDLNAGFVGLNSGAAYVLQGTLTGGLVIGSNSGSGTLTVDGTNAALGPVDKPG